MKLRGFIVFQLATLAQILSLPVLGERLVYPQAALGPVGGQVFEIDLRLGNASSTENWTGVIRLLSQQGLTGIGGLRFTDADGNSIQPPAGVVEVSIQPRGSLFYRISSPSLQIGVMVIEAVESELGDLVPSFFYRLLNSRGAVADLIAIQGVTEPATEFRAIIADTGTFNVGLALVAEKALVQSGTAPQGLPEVLVRLIAVLQDGRELAGTTTLGGAQPGQRAVFPSDVIPNCCSGLSVAQLRIESEENLYISTLAVGTPPEFEDVQIGASPASVHLTVPTMGFSADTQDRSQVVSLFRTVYRASENIAPRWDGDVATCRAGSTTAAFNSAVLRRINYFREMAEVPHVLLDPDKNAKAQQAALIFRASGTLTHTPAPTAACFSADGAAAALASNITLLSAVNAALVDSYMRDAGAANTTVGHRRWIIFPRQTSMGTGTVEAPGVTFPGANALWVIGDFAQGPRVRTSWPPRGFVPYQVVYPRWSYSFPDADFSMATVTMTRGGASVSLEVVSRTGNFGDNTIVWEPALTSESPTEDVSFTITIRNFTVNGIVMEDTYTVTIIDPDA